MIDKGQLLARAAQSILDFDEKMAMEVATAAVDAGIDPVEVIDRGFARGLQQLGDLFERGSVFLPELIRGSEVMKAAVNFLTSKFPQGGLGEPKGKVLIGTVEGDVHDIGKGIVVSLLKAYNFDVYDLGRDVPTVKFIEKAVELEVQVIGTSALLTTTMPAQKKLEEELRRAGLRDRFKTIVGGAPVTQRWAEKIGADAYAENAAEAVEKISALISSRG
jgi:trimethylamine corrinoid protein